MNNSTGGPAEDRIDSACLDVPDVIPHPGPVYAANTRAFQGIPSLACGPAERLFAVWYGGKTPGEDRNNYVILVSSKDAGKTWSDERLVIDPDGDGPVRAFDPEIWLAPDGRLWLFWAQGLDAPRIGPSGVWAIVTDEPAATEPRWSAPRRLGNGVMMCKPLVLSTGEWCLPVSLWHRRECGSAAMFVSKDQGKTWNERGACDVPPEVRNHDEHMLVERRDGSLWMLVRTRYGIGESISVDGGRSWSALKPSSIPHVRSRFFIRRLMSGRLLLVRHDPGEGLFATGESSGARSHLTAYLSDDDGCTWPYRLLLDERVAVSYPDGDQAADGTLYVIYDYQRTGARHILMAACREEDIIDGAPSPAIRLRVPISQGGVARRVVR